MRYLSVYQFLLKKNNIDTHFTRRPACFYMCISSVIYVFIAVKNILNWSWHKLNTLIMPSTFTVSKIADVSRHARIISCVLISIPLLVISTPNYIKCIFLLQIDRIIFCLFLKDDVKIYENLMQVYFPAGDLHNNL